MVNIAQAQKGVYGARMMGGGFGGCVIVLAEPSAAAAVRKTLEVEYPKRTAALPEWKAAGGKQVSRRVGFVHIACVPFLAPFPSTPVAQRLRVVAFQRESRRWSKHTSCRARNVVVSRRPGDRLRDDARRRRVADVARHRRRDRRRRALEVNRVDLSPTTSGREAADQARVAARRERRPRQ